MPDLLLRPARNDECDALTALCLRSKAVHGYDESFMAACEAELAVTPEKLAKGGHVVAKADGLLMGFAQISQDDEGWWLDALFIEPDRIGKGTGKVLFDAAMDMARKAGAASVLIDSDPGAEAFYLSRGAVRIGNSPSASIPSRVLPQLRYDLQASPP
ncbi:MAG: GNAT family N-acetyltransferase [Pseudomonadota bacterium]